jgi:uncharacterized membrane protein
MTNDGDNTDFQKVGGLLADAVERLFERVKQRKIEEFMEKIKNAKENGKPNTRI